MGGSGAGVGKRADRWGGGGSNLEGGEQRGRGSGVGGGRKEGGPVGG